MARVVIPAETLSLQEAPPVQTDESDDPQEGNRELAARSTTAAPQVSASEGSNLGQIEDSITAMRADYVER